MADFNLWQKLMDSNYAKRVALPLQYLFGDRQGAQDFLGEDLVRFANLVKSTTTPFRMGSNILAQSYGSALTGKDMSQEENQGKFLQWLSEGITPEEQDYINRKPYMAAVKSGAGIGATFLPFASRAVAATTLLPRTLQVAGRGLIEGLPAGFANSREGKELQDTAVGGALGVGGELVGEFLTNPSYRKMLEEATTYIEPRTGGRVYRAALGEDVIDSLNPSKEGVFEDYTPEFRNTAKLAENITTLDKTMGKSADDIVTIYRGAPEGINTINPGDFITTNKRLAQHYAGEGRVLERKVRLGDILDDLDEPLGEEYIYRPKRTARILK